MICKQITYADYRCIENKILTLEPEINVIRGANGTGKTSMLEGIYVFARGKSFRTQHDDELIRFGCEYASLDMVFETEDREGPQRAKMIYGSGGRKNCFFNDVRIPRISEFIGVFRAVLFCPKHLALVQSGPSGRRLFLDSAISQIEPSYIKTLQRYSAILAQRNALLKDLRDNMPGADADMLEILSEQLAESAAAVSQKRAEYTVSLNEKASALLSDMTSGSETLMIIYRSRKFKEDFLRELKENTDREIRYATTLFGVHRDDLDILHKGNDARAYASQGQQRSIALSMKLAEGEISKELTGEYPVFLFDDLLSELDRSRKDYLRSGIKGKQVIITTANDN
ncbi:MAG: DNA replication/repair protein RecF [Clostridia bacterium]|nr:DNA replication/repair protein RecF [Clostridia bacterium]